jgi:enamine deaminase RidA (YjgF/YER057c/UK114 family)
MNAQQAAALRLINPPGLYDPAPHGYSHVAVIAPGARLVIVSGQGGENERGELAPDFRAQVRQAFRNLEVAVTAGDAALGDVAKLTLLIVGQNDEKLGIFGAEFDRVWPAGRMKPACTLIPVGRLALHGMLFEVEATAVVGS